MAAGPDRDWFFVDYCTTASLGNREALRPEATEVLESYRADIGDAREAEVGSTDCSVHVEWVGIRPYVLNRSSTIFHYERTPTGGWRAVN